MAATPKPGAVGDVTTAIAPTVAIGFVSRTVAALGCSVVFVTDHTGFALHQREQPAAKSVWSGDRCIS